MVTAWLLTSSNLTRVGLPGIQYKTYTLYKRNTYKQKPKVSPVRIALVNKWQIKLGDAVTIDRFDPVFQYQMFVCFIA